MANCTFNEQILDKAPIAHTHPVQPSNLSPAEAVCAFFSLGLMLGLAHQCHEMEVTCGLSLQLVFLSARGGCFPGPSLMLLFVAALSVAAQPDAGAALWAKGSLWSQTDPHRTPDLCCINCWLWAIDWKLCELSFLIYKLGMIIAPTSQGYLEDLMG